MAKKKSKQRELTRDEIIALDEKIKADGHSGKVNMGELISMATNPKKPEVKTTGLVNLAEMMPFSILDQKEVKVKKKPKK